MLGGPGWHDVGAAVEPDPPERRPVLLIVVDEERHLARDTDFEDWLARVNCAGETAARVRALLGDRVVGGRLSLPTVVIKAVK